MDLQSALVQAGFVTPERLATIRKAKPPRTSSQAPRGKRRSRSRIEKVTALRWFNEHFGEVTVSSDWEMGDARQLGPNSWAPLVKPKREPQSVSFNFTGALVDGVRLLHISGDGVPTDMGTQNMFPEFKVPINYIDTEDGRVPSTRQNDVDDRGLVLCGPDGKFVYNEASVLTRRKRLWVGFQEVYGGQVAISTVEEAEALNLRYHEVDGHALSVIPLYDENAYPDEEDPEMFRSFLTLFPHDIGNKVVEWAYRNKAFIPLEEAEAAVWNPVWPELTERQLKNGWKPGCQAFFSMVGGIGKIICRETVKGADGQDVEKLVHVFVHFNQILNADGVPVVSTDDLPVLEPMAGYAVKYKTEGGRRKATAVQVPVAESDKD